MRKLAEIPTLLQVSMPESVNLRRRTRTFDASTASSRQQPFCSQQKSNLDK
ncbi:hypothetical protein SCAB_41021 [Streptomyces scabiei 87.22]|uniref:Uncharacterized protein n=1 Tax=Streptomyces scabiei (strain 87.22) TaxID=680198 RepID=C9Z2G1_STRSW|nr:hypothetical protein SCAB_41021 [Streptomyces scabiei 87.22]